jgi:hypothetical protein
LTTRLVDAVTTPLLLKTVVSGKLQPQQLITHHFMLDQVMQAYDTFGNAMKEEALKVIITNGITFNEVMQVSDTVGKAILKSQPLAEKLTNDSLGG